MNTIQNSLEDCVAIAIRRSHEAGAAGNHDEEQIMKSIHFYLHELWKIADKDEFYRAIMFFKNLVEKKAQENK